MEKKQYPQLDIMKFISALLVVAIHCAPFIQLDEDVNFVFVQIIARLAVPFFFITSGFLFFRSIDASKGMRDPENIAKLKHYWLRILRIYVIWSVLYLPLLVISWIQGGFDTGTLIRLLRDFLCNGTYYHLWFLPALLLAIPLVYTLYLTCARRTLLMLSVCLYAIGMVMNIYGALLVDVPVLGSLYTSYTSVFVTTRNGLFFGPIFITLGIYAKEFCESNFKKQSFIAFVVSFAGLCFEAFFLRYLGIMHDLVSMYVMLLPTLFFFFIFLLQISCKQRTSDVYLRNYSLLIYVSHIYFCFIFYQVLGLPNIVVYIGSIIGSCIVSFFILRLRKRWPFFKALYS